MYYEEQPDEKFRRLAGDRTEKAIHAIEPVGKLSGKNYRYTQEEAN